MTEDELRKTEDDMGRAFYVDVCRLEDRVKELEAENAKLKRGEWFYDCEDGENSSGDWSDVLDYADFDGPMLIAGAREVERFWIARVVLTWDEDGSPDDSEIRRFATKAEALAAMNGGQVELALATQPNDRIDPVLSIPEEAPKG
jgi:hypothetical protein